MTLVTGNTYPVKDAIKALGGRWNADKKGWMVPDEKLSQAKALVSGGAKSAQRSQKCCKDCGKPSKGYDLCWTCNKDFYDQFR